MTPVIYRAVDTVAPHILFMGQFMTDEGAMTPVTFRGADEGELRNKMLSWLEAERVKAGVTAEKIAQRKIEREAARKAKAARAALGEGKECLI